MRCDPSSDGSGWMGARRTTPASAMMGRTRASDAAQTGAIHDGAGPREGLDGVRGWNGRCRQSIERKRRIHAMADALEERVKEFVARWTSTRAERLTLDTTLFGDLGVDGADGWELVEDFGKAFGVDISAFDPGRHFGPEA